MEHDDHALTVNNRNIKQFTANSTSSNHLLTTCNDGPSSELVRELNALLERHNQPNAPPEALHELLSESLAQVLQQSTLHWWCHPDLRPISIELLHIFSLDTNSSLEQFKQIMEGILSGCLDCTESYQQDRRVYLARLLKQYDEDVVNVFFHTLLEWDCTRLEKRMESLMGALSSPETQKRKKICVCEVLLDPSLLFLPNYSERISEPLAALISQLLAHKKIKILSVLPGLWLLMLHSDVAIQSWAIYTSNLAAAGDSLLPERWNGWEQFPVVWKIALDMSSGSLIGVDRTSMPLSTDSARIWRAIRTMLSNMGRDVIHLAIKNDKASWMTLRTQLLKSIKDSETPSAIFLETCRIAFHLVGNLKQDFWRNDAGQMPEGLEGPEEILRSAFKHRGTLEYITALVTKEQATKDALTTQALSRVYAEYTTWISHFINSLSGIFHLSEILISTASDLLSVISRRIAIRTADAAPAPEMDHIPNNEYLEFDLEMISIVFQLLSGRQDDGLLGAIVETLSEHLTWLGPICALGSGALNMSGLAPHTAQRIAGLAARTSAAGRRFTFALLERESGIMWRNYGTATITAKAEVVGRIDKANPVLWLRLAQTTSSIGRPDHRDRLDPEYHEQLMEWQTCMLEHFAKLTLLPKLEIKPRFSEDTLRMSGLFNDDLDVVFRANSILLQGFATQGEEWLKRLTNHDNKRFLVKLLKLWCSPDPETKTQALFIMRFAWQEVTRPSCLRLAYQLGGERSMEELDSILADFRDRGSPGGATPPALFELLLDSVTTLFLNNSIDGEGGLYLQIFLDLTSSQDVAQHVSLIKTLWNSIWLSLKAAFVAGRTTWADLQDRQETIRTMKVVANVGLLIIGKIRYFERLLEFEKQGLDANGLDQDMVDEFDEQKPSTRIETMPLEAMKDGLPRIADWTYAQDTTLCTSAIELVCAVLNLLADHSSFIGDKTNAYLTGIAEGNPKIKSLLTPEQRETLWITLSRHVAYANGAAPSSLQKTPLMQETSVSAAKNEPIEISDDDFDDINEVDLVELDFDEDDKDDMENQSSASVSKDQNKTLTVTTPSVAPASSTRPNFFYQLTSENNPYQTKLNFTSIGSSGGIPAGGSTTARRLPASLNRFGNLAQKLTFKPTPKALEVKKGSKLSQMRADHRRERMDMAAATKIAREIAKRPPIPNPAVAAAIVSKPSVSESESESGSESDDMDSGLSSLVDAEEKWNNRNNKAQEPRKTKLLDLKEVIGPAKFVDTVAIRRQKVIEDAQRQNRLAPNLAALHAQILKWDVSSAGDRPPGDREYTTIPSRFNSVNDYIKAFEPLLVLECWQQLMGAREEANQSSDSVLAQFINRVSIDNFQDIHMKIPLDRASSLMVEDVVVVSDPVIKDVFSATGNAARAKPFFAKVQSITKAKGECEVIFRTYLKIEESSPLMFMRPKTTWSVLKMLNLTTTHREYAALAAMRYYELCNDILNPPNTPVKKPSLENTQKVMDIYQVNTPQAQAIVAAIEKPIGFTLIQGPPGTGKTKTILGLVGALLADGSRQRAAPVVQSSRVSERPLQTGTVSRILVCAPSNAAIDEIVKRLKGGIRNTVGQIYIPKVVRVGTLETVNAEVRDVALDTLIAKELESSSSSKEEFQSVSQSLVSMREKMRQLQQDLEKARLELVQAKDASDPMSITNAQSKVKAINKSKWQLGQELDSARSNQQEASQKKDQARKDARNKILGEADVICSTLSASGHDLLTTSVFTFESVIIDEAAQSVEISSLIPLKYGCKRCILVGDPNQLPPTVISQLAAQYAYNQSLFVRIQRLAPTSVHLLSIQYRMHPDISIFPSREFYKALLKDGPDMEIKTKAEWHRNPITPPYRFFDVYAGREEIGLSHSQHNPIEAEAAVALLEGLCNGNPTLNFFRRVGVISPYKQQVRTLKEYFQRVFDKGILEAVDFNTVDGFQGQEKDIIIFSCVRASARGSVGFLADIRRMNVALTRARQSLFILGHANTLRREEIWGDLVRDAEDRGLFTRVVPGIFGRRGATSPQNILKPNITADRRNEMYGRVADTRLATAIERPMATIDDIMEVSVYPTLPEPGKNLEQQDRSLLQNSVSRGDEGESQNRENDHKRGMGPSDNRYWTGQGPPEDEYKGGRAPRPSGRMDSYQPHPPQDYRREFDDHRRMDGNKDHSHNPSPRRQHHSSDGLPPYPSDSESGYGGQSGHLNRPPSPKRSKATPSLFLKSKPRDMRTAPGSSRQSDPRERLAAQVIPIRKSYPARPNYSSGSSRPAQPPPHYSKRPSAPSLDDILNTMNKKPRGT